MKNFRALSILTVALLMLASLPLPISYSQQIDYAQRERQAPPAIRATLATLRNEIQTKRFTFQVGYTLAADRNLEQLAGLKPPTNLAAIANKQNALAVQLLRIDNASREEYARLNPNVKLPELSLQCNPSAAAFDWRKLGKVTPVRDQGGCGSCWAFATIGAYEGSYLIRNGGSPDASEQDVLSCSGLGTCAGGWWAFDFLLGKGDASEASYPYTATDSPCNASIPDPYWATTWGYVKPGGATPSVGEMKQALCQYGPLAVAVRVTTAFRHYTAGVFNENASGSVNHGVTLIGWDDTKGAWLIKNSWGTGWGDTCGYGSQRGYMWITYGSNSIGYAAAWVRAKSRYYKLPDTYYRLVPKIIPTP
ncbi:MAG: C1 family peptidase [Acidobacteriota bacterium]